MSLSMPRISLLALTALLPSTFAFAGSQSLDCVSRDKTIQVGAGNSSLETQIKYVDKDGKPGVLKVPGNILPDFDYNDSEEKSISIIPVSKKTNVKEKHQTMRVTRKDGTSCYGRQAWDDTYTQTYLVTAKNGKPLRGFFEYPYDQKLPGINEDGYIVKVFSCHSYGVTTAGGCFVQDDSDIVEWIDDDKIENEGK